jgi:hypothetical protein
MTKKVFALASVTVLTGLMAAVAVSACSSTDSPGDASPAFATPDARADGPVKPAPSDEDVMQTCPTTAPVTAADIGPTWVGPALPQTICNQQNLDDLKALFAKGNGNATHSDMEKTLGATCSPCVFTPVNSPTWGILIKDGNRIVADNSLGSCFTQFSDAKCGKAVFELDACAEHVCPQEECTDRQACMTKALNGACKDFSATLQKDCPRAADIQRQCDNFIKIVAASCAGGPDAGVDASL